VTIRSKLNLVQVNIIQSYIDIGLVLTNIIQPRVNKFKGHKRVFMVISQCTRFTVNNSLLFTGHVIRIRVSWS